MKKPILNIALVQTDLFWKDPVANRAMLEEKISAIQEPVDMVVLPEMFTTGFTMDADEVAEPMNLTTVRWMKQIAAQAKAVITGSVVIREKQGFFNRLLWVNPDGEVDWYDKRHLFRMAEEDAHYQAGQEQKVFICKGWKLMPQVCYDLRFPIWSRNTIENNELAYDVVFYVASWPSPRIQAWDALLKSRAIENLSYSIGVNRVGQDGNMIPYPGHSAVYDFKGETLAFSDQKDEILLVSLDYKKLEEYREKFPAWKDAESFQILGKGSL